MISFWSLFTGLLWLGFLIGVGIVILAYGSYKNYRLLRQSAVDSSARVEAAIRERASQIHELCAFLVRRGGWRNPVPTSTTGALEVYRNSSRLLHQVREFVERLPELKESSEYRDLIRRVEFSGVDVWQRFESYRACLTHYELARSSFPTLLFTRFAEQSSAELLDLQSLRALRLGSLVPVEGVDDADRKNLFYVLPGGVPKGPVSADDLRSLIAAGLLPADVLIADGNSEEWRPINLQDTSL